MLKSRFVPVQFGRARFLTAAITLAAANSAVSGQTQLDKLTAPDQAAVDNFGNAVAIHGDLVLVGSRWDDSPTDAGSAHLFRRNGDQWQHEFKFIAPDRASFDEFGISVALTEVNGDELAIIGAWLDANPSSGMGSVYVFRNDAVDGWILEQKLSANDKALGDNFGFSLAAEGDTLVVGALRGDGATVSNSGTAYVFQRIGQNWFQVSELVPPDGAAFDEFGQSVAISGDYIIVGARLDDHVATDAGSAYIYQRTGGVWMYHSKLTHPAPVAGDQFGFAVGISGNVAVVGARLDDPPTNAGSVHVFRNNGSTWVHEQQLVANDAATNDNFGSSVTINGDMIAVGVPLDGSDSGSVYLFGFDGAAWNQLARIVADDVSDLDSFGTAVALSGDLLLVVGAIGDDGNNDNLSAAGAAYVFQIEGSISDPDSDGDGLSDNFELQIGTDPFNPDTDGDGLSDGIEWEIAQTNNDCPSPLLYDSDGDGLSDSYENDFGPNNCDPDVDGDGLLDGAEVALGTSFVNPDTDGDGLSDGLEVAFGTNPLVADTDNDGLSDGMEVQIANGGGCPNPALADSDGDGLLDGFEFNAGFNPCDADADNDNLADGDELNRGTNPNDPDSDDDGLLDGDEVALAAGGNCPDPLNADSDGDGVLDGDELTAGLGPCDPDFDNDGLSDGNEAIYGTDPANADTDGDGLLDGTEIDIALGTGCPDPLVADSDGDSLLDGAEAAAGTNPCGSDTDGDGFGDQIDPTPTQPGVPANFVANLTQATAGAILDTDQSLFLGPNANARIARRTAMAALVLTASLLIEFDQYTAARAVLTVVERRVDGASPPPDWMTNSPARASLHADLDTIIVLLELLE